MRDWIRRHPTLTLVGVIVGALLTVFVFVWFEPHKAFIDERVDETIPTAAPTTTTTATPSTTAAPAVTDDATSTTTAPTTTIPAATFPLTLSASTFVDVAHGGSGTVLALELEDGSRLIRFEDLDVDNGPDLVVILSDRPITGADDYADGEWVSLGELKGNQGNQNYEIPADVDLSEWATVAIWCRRFNTTFNAATLDIQA
jgi:hypothetical protein